MGARTTMTSRALIVRCLRLGVVFALAICVTPAGADASKVGVDATGYTADSGETNNVSANFLPGGSTGTYIITDSGVASITDADGPGGCTVSGNEATCVRTIICALGGAPFRLNDGNDRLSLDSDVPCSQDFGDQGDDVMFGGDGVDRIDGGIGADQTSGGGGNDVLHEASADFLGNDVQLGGEGDDNIEGAAGNDVMQGGAGDDSINGDFFVIPGGSNQIPCTGCTFNDEISGDGGDDSLQGNAGDDLVQGGDGNDSLDAGEAGQYLGADIGQYDGADRLDGGAGSDVLYGRPSASDDDTSDDLFCGDGPDDFAFAGASDVVSTTCEGWTQFVLCPGSATSWCEGSISVASTGAAASKKRAKVVLGAGKLKRTTPGGAREVRFSLKPKKVRRVLHGRSEAAARAITRTHDKRKKLPTQKTRFTLKR